jgi:short-subunit dehydrogenase
MKQKVILVTGASEGIGLEVARALCREGAQVVFAARSKDKLEKAAQAAGGLAVVMDVTSDQSVKDGVDAILARFGRIDIVINNAGNAGAMSLWAAMDADAVRRMFDVHVLGAERVMRAVLPSMLQRRAGMIVNFASAVAWVPMPGAAAYSAAKAAVVSLSEALREELRESGIDVRLFAPPHTSTDAGKALPLDLPKIFAPEWVAEQLVHFLRGKRARVLPGGNSMLLFLRRISPSLASRIMNGLGFKALAKVQAQLPAASSAPDKV